MNRHDFSVSLLTAVQCERVRVAARVYLQIHSGVDDLGSKQTLASLTHGSAGRAVACCVIGLSDTMQWPEDKDDSVEPEARTASKTGAKH